MTKRSTRRTTRRSAGRSSGGSRRAAAPRGPSPAQCYWLGGLLLLLAALLAFTGLISAHPGSLVGWWLGALRSLFGWGAAVAAAILAILGVWLVARGAARPLVLPWARLAGWLIVFLAGLAFSHHLALAAGLEEAALVGGQVGRWIDQPLRSALGGGGAVVILAMILIGGLMLAFNLSLMELSADLAEFGDRASDHLRGWRLAREARRRARAAARAEQIELPLNMSAAGARPTGANPPGIVSRGPAEAPAQTPSVPAAPLPAPTAEAAHAPAVLRRSDPPPDADPLASPMAGPGHPWALPRVAEMLAESEETQLSLTDIREKTHTIEETLRSLGVPVTVVEVNPGPVVTQFGLEPGYVERRERDGKVKRAKVKVSRIAALSNDLALALAAAPIRIETPVPGKGIVGLEVPNLEKSTVGLRGVIESEQFRALKSRLAVGFGRDVSGEAVVDDLTDLPHLLIAGATGSGKSVCINALVACLLYHNTPDDLKMLMIDPKRVELSVYNGIPHLLAPVVVEMDRVVGVLNWVAREMDRRYKVFARVGARNIQSFNESAAARGETHMPYVVVFIDELADLMMAAPDEVERSICRIAQMARATGIHLVIATQRPSVDVVTGLIKANFPARISFAVTSQVDSRVILDTPGAEKLLGRGDALYMASDSPKLLRVQGCWVSDAEINRLVDFWKGQAHGRMPGAALSVSEAPAGGPAVQQPLWPDMAARPKGEDDADPLLREAVAIVVAERRASVSYLQRKLRIGYTRAGRLIDLLEEKGIIGPAEGGAKIRDVLIDQVPEEYGPVEGPTHT